MNQDVWHVFRHCPRCGAKLLLKETSDGAVLRCSADGLTFFQNLHSAVAAIITNPNHDVLFIQRAKEPKIGQWDLPGGFVTWGEDPEAAIIREIREELGVRFVPQGVFMVAHDWYLFEGLLTSVNTIGFQGIIDGTIRGNEEVGSLHWLDTNNLPDQNIGFSSVEKTIEKLRRRK